MSGGYDAADRRRLELALKQGSELRCPSCDVALSRQPVEPRAELAYVRRRVWVLCPRCRRTASLDIAPGH